jgi:hypothetical protein
LLIEEEDLQRFDEKKKKGGVRERGKERRKSLA